ncbi:MAG: acyltransferase family protein, partial [Limisphaerales bacterium]
KILRRAAILFALGLFLNAFTFFYNGFFSPKHEGFAFWMNDMAAHLRYPGVLQRIGICYLFAGLIFLNTKIRGQAIWIFGLLASYWAMMKLIPVPGFGAGILDLRGNFSEFVDTIVFNGHVFRDSTTYDPEGIISTLPAIATVLLGIMAGHLLRSKKSAEEKTVWLFVAGNTLLFAGQLMNFWLPINKRIWTSSYSVFMAGLAMNVFAIYYWFIDVKGYRSWAKPFAIYGMNAITVFVLSGILGRLSLEIKMTGASGEKIPLKVFLYDHLFAHLASPKNSSLLWAIGYVLVMYLVAYFMYRKKWFIKF